MFIIQPTIPPNPTIIYSEPKTYPKTRYSIGIKFFKIPERIVVKKGIPASHNNAKK
jgi:hypothetical protein